MRHSLDVKLPDGPILKYYAYVATGAAWFIVPIWTLFLLEQGLSYTQLAILNGVWWTATVLGEVPTGYVGDRIGRRNSLLLGSLTSVVAVLAFGQMSSFWGILAVYVVWGVGTTFRSGADSAWLYDTLAEDTDEEAFTRIKGRGSSIRLAVMAGSAAVGGYLAAVDMYAPFVATAAVVAVGATVTLTMPKNRAYREECRGGAKETPADCPDADAFGPRDAIPVIRDTLAAPPLRSFVVAVGAFYAIAWSAGMYTQPIAEDVAFRLGMDEAGMTAMLGWLYAGFSAVSAVVTFYADRLEAAIGAQVWVRVAPALLGLAFLLASLVPVLAVPAFFLMRALLNATDVLKDRYVNDRTESLGRATVLSAASMLFGLARVPFRLLSGVVGDLTAPLTAVGIIGALLVLSATLVVLRYGIDVPAGTPGEERTCRAC
ncbi:MAG: hypothetical protein ACI9YT_001420 [Halobacteriales archaeon]|jgi:hypothetical protein